MTEKYLLDGRTPVRCNDITKWAEAFEKIDCKVAVDTIGESRISTVFLGIDYSFGDGPPLLFQTMIFDDPDIQFTEHYSTWEQAEAGHQRAVALVSDTPNSEERTMDIHATFYGSTGEQPVKAPNPTPGPWEWDCNDRLIGPVDATCGCHEGTHKICLKDFGFGQQTVVHQCDTVDAGPLPTNCPRDRALLETAPDMLLAIRALIGVDGGMNHKTALDMGLAALRKIYGTDIP